MGGIIFLFFVGGGGRNEKLGIKRQGFSFFLRLFRFFQIQHPNLSINVGTPLKHTLFVCVCVGGGLSYDKKLIKSIKALMVKWSAKTFTF